MPPDFALHHKRTFLRKLEEVDRKRASGNPYELVEASAILRLLLLDGPALLHLVNRHYRLKLVYEVTKQMVWPPGLEPDWFVDNIDPESSLFQRKQVSEKEFLATVCIGVKGEKFTVKEMIKLCAHVFGGVHAGTPDAREERILELHDIHLINVSAVVFPIIGIINVVTKALQPLKDAVSAELDMIKDGTESEST